MSGENRDIKYRIQKILNSEMLKLNVLASVTGLFVAILTWIFLELIDLIINVLYLGGDYIDNDLGYWAILIPGIGGLIAGTLIKYGNVGARGHGIPVVMESIAINQSKLGTRLALTKIAAAATSIGAGFSLGRVGPVVLMAATFGSDLGQRAKLSIEETRILIGAGTAAAITTAFNAPLGGVIFAMELILSEMRTRSFIPLVVATVMATAVARSMEGDLAAFSDLPEYTTPDSFEYPLYLILGLVIGLAAVGFIKLLYAIDEISEKGKWIPLPIQTTIGGILVGIIGLVFPEILGNGFGVTQEIILGENLRVDMNRGPGGVLSMENIDFYFTTVSNITVLLVCLFVFKLIATSISIGSGASGGVFTPSLFIGASIGAVFGHVVGVFDFTSPAGAYALVGMAAFVAATTRATLTAIVLLFEMSDSYEIILPLMLSCVVADGVCYVLSEQSIYTAKLARHGVKIDLEAEQDLMRMLTVEEGMTKEIMSVEPETPIEATIEMLEDTGHMSFPVIEYEKLLGIITWTDIHRAVEQGDRDRTVEEYYTKELITITPKETLSDAMDKLGQKEIGHLPVVDPEDSTKLIGYITKGDIVKIYNRKRLAKNKMSWEE